MFESRPDRGEDDGVVAGDEYVEEEAEDGDEVEAGELRTGVY